MLWLVEMEVENQICLMPSSLSCSVHDLQPFDRYVHDACAFAVGPRGANGVSLISQDGRLTHSLLCGRTVLLVFSSPDSYASICIHTNTLIRVGRTTSLVARRQWIRRRECLCRSRLWQFRQSLFVGEFRWGCVASDRGIQKGRILSTTQTGHQTRNFQSFGGSWL